MDRDLEGTGLENWWQPNLWKSHVDRLLWIGKKTWIYVSYVNAQQRINSAEENFNKQANDSFCGYQLAFCSSDCPITTIEVMYGLSNMTFCSPKSAWLYPLLSILYLSAAETNTPSPIWHHSLEWPTSYLVASWLHWTTCITEGATYSYWNRYLLWMVICLPCRQNFWQNNHPRSYRMPHLPSWHPI